MLLSGVDGPISTNFSAELGSLLKARTDDFTPSAETLKMLEEMPKWADAAKAYPLRAVICKPHTTADVDASLLRIKAMGFNQMWLTVFENGKARIPGTGFPLDPACDPKVDIFTYAIAEGKKKGITVCPVVSPYAWGTDAPKDARLLTLRGENSVQSAARHSRIFALNPELLQAKMETKDSVSAPAMYVDPAQPEIQKGLTGTVQSDFRSRGDRRFCLPAPRFPPVILMTAHLRPCMTRWVIIRRCVWPSCEKATATR